MTGTFSCTLKFIVKDCDPNTGEPDDEGYEDEYVVSGIWMFPERKYMSDNLFECFRLRKFSSLCFCAKLHYVDMVSLVLIPVWLHSSCFSQLEDLEITVADHTQKVMKPNFAASWEEVGPENELEDTYALSTMKSLEGMVGDVISVIKWLDLMIWLTHCGPVMPYGDIDLGQHWFR